MTEVATKAASPDPRVAAAIAHWAPRFVSNGVLLADFEEVTAGIERWEDWCAAWCERGEVHEALGREALKGGPQLTAGEHLVRASMYYHFAKFVFVHDLKQMREAHQRSVGCYKDALAHMRRRRARGDSVRRQDDVRGAAQARERVGARTDPRHGAGPGLDQGRAARLRRAVPRARIAILAIDGPGQGEAEYEIPICGDYERAARAACDWIEKRPDLDAAKVGMWGVSLGGYYAPRATAYEKRIKACIGISGRSNGRRSGRRSRTDARGVSGAQPLCDRGRGAEERRDTLDEGRRAEDRLPDLHRHRAAGPSRSASHAERLARSVSGPVELLIVEDGGHNANNRPYRYRSRTADWLAGQLKLPRI